MFLIVLYASCISLAFIIMIVCSLKTLTRNYWKQYYWHRAQLHLMNLSIGQTIEEMLVSEEDEVRFIAKLYHTADLKDLPTSPYKSIADIPDNQLLIRIWSIIAFALITITILICGTVYYYNCKQDTKPRIVEVIKTVPTSWLNIEVHNSK